MTYGTFSRLVRIIEDEQMRVAMRRVLGGGAFHRHPERLVMRTPPWRGTPWDLARTPGADIATIEAPTLVAEAMRAHVRATLSTPDPREDHTMTTDGMTTKLARARIERDEARDLAAESDRRLADCRATLHACSRERDDALERLAELEAAVTQPAAAGDFPCCATTEPTTSKTIGEPVDSEIDAIGRLVRILGPMPPATRERAIAYVTDRFGGIR